MAGEKGFADADMLLSKDEIKYAFDLSEYMFWEYVDQGMPALYINRRWSASIKRIQAWWEQRCNVTMRDRIKQIKAEEKRDENFPDPHHLA